MVLDHEWFSPTRTVGLSATTVSFLACGWGWLHRRKERAWCRSFAWLMLLQLCLVLDMAFDGRWKLHDLGIRIAVSLGVYSQRSTPQLLALLFLFLAIAYLSALVLYRSRARVGLALAGIGTMLSVGLCFCESVSYHTVDAFLYHLVGTIMRVGWIWIGFSTITCLGVWIDTAGSGDGSWKDDGATMLAD
jgi:hypothetical protein